MKSFNYLTGIFAALALFLAACKKTDFDKNVTGEALGDFRLASPSSNTVLNLNPATPNETVVIAWTAAKPGLNTTPTYKWIAAAKTGSLDQPALEIPSDNNGRDTKLTLTHQAIDQALSLKGIPTNGTADFIWSVVADNGTSKTRSGDVWNIKITRSNNGATPFILLAPASSTDVMTINPTSLTDQLKFNWTRSKPATGSPSITYKVLFAERKLDANGNELPINWSAPLFSMASNVSGTDSLLTVSTKQFGDSLASHGYADLSLQANLKWTAVATSGTWNQLSDYANNLFITRQVRLYLVGNITGWDINNPWELVVDKKLDRYGKVFYTYFNVPAGGAQFLFIKERGNWGSKYGITGGGAPTYDVGYNTGADFFITTPGLYRITIDVGNLKAYIQQKQVGVVGNMQGWNPGSPIYGGYVKRDQFLIIAPSNGTDEFKFHDGPVWDNGTPDKARWWGETSGGNLDADGNGANLVANTAPRTRLIWDATNTQQIRYEKSPAAEMRVVGDGMQGVNAWDPGASPQMTYSGNGTWTLTLNLIGNKEIKFLAGNAWGAFDYEDNSGGSQATGTPRAIKWDGGPNFKTPASSGSYTITLNEHTQTVTIN